MVSAGPRPGSTPIAVPSVVPTRHHIRLIGVKATAKPWASWLSVSMASASDQSAMMASMAAFSMVLDEAGADVDAERLGEAEIGGERQDQRRAARRAADAGCRSRSRRSTNMTTEAAVKPSGWISTTLAISPAATKPSAFQSVGRVLFLLGLPAAAQRGHDQQQRRAARGRPWSCRERRSGRPWNRSATPGSPASARARPPAQASRPRPISNSGMARRGGGRLAVRWCSCVLPRTAGASPPASPHCCRA